MMHARKPINGVVLAAFAATLAVCGVGAGPALATEFPEWQQGKAKLSEAVGTKSKGKVKLYDEGAEAEVECEGSSEGTAGPGVADETKHWTLSSCKATPKALNKKGEEKPNKCEKALSAAVVRLPWRSELVLFGKSIVDENFGVAGEPGYEFACEVFKIKVTDTCSFGEFGGGPSSTVTNVTGGVDEAYNAGGLACTVGGTASGKFETTQLLEATKGSALEANIV